MTDLFTTVIKTKDMKDPKWVWPVVGTIIGLWVACIIWLLLVVIDWENDNMQKVWIDYEVKILDKDKVVLYKTEDVSDSIVFRCDTGMFSGVQAIEKLEYKLP